MWKKIISSWMISAGNLSIKQFVPKRIATILLCVFSFTLVSCSGTKERVEHLFQGLTMGTSYSVKVIDATPATNEIDSGIEALLHLVNGSMSTYLPDSELSLFNRQQSTEWMIVSSELIEVLELAENVSKQSNGAFDITVGPVVNLWGFGPEGRSLKKPDSDQIASLLSHVGYKKLIIDAKEKRIRKLEPSLYLDLSAIAKGYAVDRIADYLEQLGVKDYLVEVGGEIRVKGKNRDNKPWRIAVEKPAVDSRTVQQVLELNDQAIATSGDYRNYFEVDGRRFSHTIDPRTGRPITNRVGSASVISSTAAFSDAMATAFMVLGVEEGIVLADKLKLKVMFLVKINEGFLVQQSSAFTGMTSSVTR